ncbi:MAG: PAS domain S-box protein [Pelobium sp.]
MKGTYEHLKHSRILFCNKTDLNGNYTYLSPYFSEFFNYPVQNYIGTPSLATIIEEDHKQYIAILNQCLLSPEKSHSVILRKPLHTGEVIHTQWEITLIIDDEDQPLEFISVGYDISKNIESERNLELLNSEIEDEKIKYQTLFETSSLGIVLHDLDGTIDLANETFCRMVGIKKSKAKQYNILDFVPEEFKKQFIDVVSLLKTTKLNSSLELEFHGIKGLIVPISANKLIFKDQYGQLKIWNVIKDITDRKHQKELLKKQNELLQETADIAKLGGWELNLETSKIECTKEVYHIYDLAIGYDLDFKNGLSFYHPDYRKKVSNAVYHTIKSFEPFDLEVRFISAKGKNKWLKISGRAVSKDGKIDTIKGIIQDITKRKLAEETIIKQNELLKEAYFAQSHLVRPPIANIIGLITLLDITHEDVERYQIYQKIKKSVHQLDLIIKDVAQKKL